MSDVVAAVEKLRVQGCTILTEPFEVRMGKCTVILDPFGIRLWILDDSNVKREAREI